MKWKRHGCITETVRHNKQQCPVVDIHNDGFWRIYYTHRCAKDRGYISYIDVEPGYPENILDYSYSFILQNGDVGQIDSGGVMATSILTLNNEKLLYYVGWANRMDIPYFYTTCVATHVIGNDKDWGDRNGFTPIFTKKGPILGPDLIDSGCSGTMYPFYDSDTNLYYGYYESCNEWVCFDDRQQPIHDIKKAQSLSGIKWTKEGEAINLEKDEGGIAQPSIAEINKDLYRMWFCVRGNEGFRKDFKNDKTYRIKYAESTDLISWKRGEDESLFLLPTDDPYDWDGIMTCYPCIIKYDGTLFMFYNGNGFGQSGIGYATYA